MATYKPAQIFASIATDPLPKQVKKQPSVDEKYSPPTRENEIQVTATGEVTLPPDRCRATISVTNTKDQVQEVKNSVSRRVDYVMQTLANHQIRVSIIFKATVPLKT